MWRRWTYRSFSVGSMLLGCAALLCTCADAFLLVARARKIRPSLTHQAYIQSIVETRKSQVVVIPRRLNDPTLKCVDDKSVAAEGVISLSSAPSTDTTGTNKEKEWTHADICWKLGPPPETPLWQKLQWTLSAKLLRLQCQWQGVEPPRLIFPLGGQAVLEAHDKNNRNIKLGRFGILTEAGPSTVELEETVQEIYHNNNNNDNNSDDDDDAVLTVRAAAIIYMFVEPAYRGRGLGARALEVIAYLHAARGCAYTVLVANDRTTATSTGSNDSNDNNHVQKLVQWYERHGYTRAPKLQEVLGSPDGVYGVTMIAPTATSVPENCVVEWW